MKGIHRRAPKRGPIVARRGIALGLVLTMFTAGIALADNLIADADGLVSVGSDQVLDLGSVCPGSTASKTVLLAINRNGNGTNVFANSGSVAVTVLSETGGFAAEVTDGEIVLPSNWTGQANNKVSGDFDGGTAAATVSFTAGTSSGAFAGTTAFRARGLNAATNTAPSMINRDTSLVLKVTVLASTHADCAPVDGTPPVLTLPGDLVVEATELGGGAYVSFSASATDAVDGNVAVACTPVSGSLLPLGATTVSCSASDAAGNIGTGAFSVAVVDTTPPALSPIGDVTKEATGPLGAEHSFSVSAVDVVDGSVRPDCMSLSGSTFGLGSTRVDCTATDAAGNPSDVVSFFVNVVDTTPPELTLPTDIMTHATGDSSASVSFSATAYDLVDGSVPVTCTPGSGSSFAVGPTTVTCSAKDSRHNESPAESFTVTVAYSFDGFFRPIDMSKPNVVKAGSAVPVKFSLGGYQGMDVLADSYPRVTMTSACGGGASYTLLTDETITMSNSGLSYDATSDQYNYVWKTAKTMTGCRLLTVMFADGTTETALFQFTK